LEPVFPLYDPAISITRQEAGRSEEAFLKTFIIIALIFRPGFSPTAEGVTLA
jgi:hypothetical protein